MPRMAHDPLDHLSSKPHPPETAHPQKPRTFFPTNTSIFNYLQTVISRAIMKLSR